MGEPLPTPPSRFVSMPGLTSSLGSGFEVNPFEEVFGQKAAAGAATSGTASTGDASNNAASSQSKDGTDGVPLLNTPLGLIPLTTPPPSLSVLLTPSIGKSSGDSYFTSKGGADTAPAYASMASFTQQAQGVPALPTEPIPTSPAGDPHLGLRLLAEAPQARTSIRLAEMPRTRPPAGAASAGPPAPRPPPEPLTLSSTRSVRPAPAAPVAGSKRKAAGAPAASVASAKQARTEGRSSAAAKVGAVTAAKRAAAAQPQREATPEEKRQQFLERNKMAASKCRAKKKQWMAEMEARAKELSQTNAELHAQLSRLRSEADILREILLAHRDCSCTKIQQYLQVNSSTLHLLSNPSLALAGAAVARLDGTAHPAALFAADPSHPT